MRGFRAAWALALAVAAGLGSLPALAQVEPPILAERVKRGELPPMAERLPLTPRVTNLAGMGREPGIPGGEIRLLMADQRDLRIMSVYGYSRLMVFNLKQELEPVTVAAMDGIKNLLLDLAREKCRATSEAFSARAKLLDMRPSMLDKFASLVERLQGVRAAEPDVR